MRVEFGFKSQIRQGGKKVVILICVRDLIRTTYRTLAEFGDKKKALHGQRSQACNNIQVP